MSELKKSLLISFLNKYSILVITIISSMIIARLLTPKEIGIFSVAASLIGIAHTLRDFGVSSYLVQTKEISEDKIKSAFTITALMAWSIASLLFLSKEYIANFYNQSELRTIIQILSLNFIILPFSSITIALLKREMQFGKLYKITVIAALAQALTTISLAKLNYGFYSLAWGGFANVLITSIGAQFISPTFSNFRFSFKATKTILNFGGKLSISSLAFEMGNYAPDLVIGKVMGFLSVGLYSRAFGFVSLVEHTLTDAIRPILLPYFSKENREGQEINTTFLKITNYYLAIVLPLLGLIALMAYPMIRLLYGTQWDAAIPIAQILCLGMAFKSSNFLIGSVILARGFAGRILTAQLLYQSLRITAIVYGVLYSLKEIAIGLVIVEFVGFFIFYSQTKNIDIKLLDLIYLFSKNTLILLLVITPSSITYFIHLNFESIDINNLISNPLINYQQYIIIPRYVSELENLYLIVSTSIIALISWLIVIFIMQKDLWRELTNILFTTRKK